MLAGAVPTRNHFVGTGGTVGPLPDVLRPERDLPDEHLRLRSRHCASVAIRAWMSQISWRTSAAHQPTEHTTTHPVSGTRLGQIGTGTQGTRSQSAIVPRRPR